MICCGVLCKGDLNVCWLTSTATPDPALRLSDCGLGLSAARDLAGGSAFTEPCSAGLSPAVSGFAVVRRSEELVLLAASCTRACRGPMSVHVFMKSAESSEDSMATASGPRSAPPFRGMLGALPIFFQVRDEERRLSLVCFREADGSGRSYERCLPVSMSLTCSSKGHVFGPRSCFKSRDCDLSRVAALRSRLVAVRKGFVGSCLPPRSGDLDARQRFAAAFCIR
mmetsp:Transcript_9194/g.22981  ORF Transcript_9194/g.22981 Transcript_9194/m.22981 type:complete len:225 (+) Transcript_9194:228-902(+)